MQILNNACYSTNLDQTFKEHAEIKEFRDEPWDARSVAKMADSGILVQEFIYDVLRITWNITKILVKIMLYIIISNLDCIN